MRQPPVNAIKSIKRTVTVHFLTLRYDCFPPFNWCDFSPLCVVSRLLLLPLFNSSAPIFQFVILILPFHSRYYHPLFPSRSISISFVAKSSHCLSLTCGCCWCSCSVGYLFCFACLWMECTKINSWIRFFMPWKTYISQHFLYLSIPITLCECAQILFLHSYMH